MKETKAAFAERKTRSLGNVLYSYLEDYEYKYFHLSRQFVAARNSRDTIGIDKKPKNANNSDFMSILYSKSLGIYKTSKCTIGDRNRSSKQDLPFRKVTIRNLHKKFVKLCHC